MTLHAKQKRAMLFQEIGGVPGNRDDDIEMEKAMDAEEAEYGSEVIKGFTDADLIGLEDSQGGVGLANRSTILINGVVSGDEGISPNDLIRYKQVRKVDSMGSVSVVCSGYHAADPETEFNAATTAANNALSGAPNFSVSQAEALCINVCGGEDLSVGDSLNAINTLVEGLDVSSSAKIVFNSISDATFAVSSASIAVCIGEDYKVFQHDGNYYELSDDDIDTSAE